MSQDYLLRMPYQSKLGVSQAVLHGVLIREVWAPDVATSTIQPSSVVFDMLAYQQSRSYACWRHILAETGGPKDSNGQVLLCKWL